MNHGLTIGSARDIAYVLFRHKGKMLAFFLFTVALVTGVMYLLPPSYASEAVLLIRVGRENMPGDPTVRDSILNATQDRTSEVKSITAILTSQDLAEKTVNAIGEGWILDQPDLPRHDVGLPEPPPPSAIKKVILAAIHGLKDVSLALGLSVPMTPHEEAVATVMKNLHVEVTKQTNVITVTYKAETPEVAQVTLDKLIGFYLDRHIEVFAQQASPQFFEEQTARLKAELAEREQTLDQFRATHGITAIDAQKQVLLERISGLEKDVIDTEAAANGARAQTAAIEKELAGKSRTLEVSRTTGRTNYAADALKEKLADLKLQASEMSSRYPDTHRPLISLREQIQQAEAALAREQETRTEVTTGVDTTYLSLRERMETERTQLAAHEARLEALRAELKRTREQLANLTAQETEFARLTREMAIKEKEFLEYQENLREARLAAAMDVARVSNVSVVQPASMPADPIGGGRLRNILLGIALGLFGAICLAFVAEFFDDRLNTPAAIERRLGVPALITLTEEEFKACT